jgi:predicted ABC-type ATPase
MAQARPNLVVLAGPNGSGKTTTAPALLRDGWRFHLVFLWLPSADLAVARVAARVRMGGHSVPDAVIRRRYELGLRNFFPLYRPLAASWRMYDNSVCPQPRLIAAGEYDTVTLVAREATWRSIRRRYAQTT